MKRFLFWFVGGLVALSLLVFLGLGLYTKTDHFRSWAREQLLSALRSSVNGEVTLERLSGSLWTGITFHNLSLQQNSQEVVFVPSGTLRFDLLPQLLSFVRSSSVRVGALILTAPVLHLSQDLHTGWNIFTLFQTQDQPESAESAKTSSQLSVFLDRLSITDGQITIQPADGETIRLDAVSLAGRLDVPPAGVQIDLGTLSFAVTQKGLPEVHLNGGLAYDATQSPPALSLRQVNLRTVNSQIQLSGTVQNLSSPLLAVTVEAKPLAVADLHAYVPTLPLQQDLSGTIEANGPLSALQVHAAVSTPDGQTTTQFIANLTQPAPQYAGTLTVKDFAVDKILSVTTVSGIINGHSTFAITGRDLQQANFELQIGKTMARGQEIGNLTASGTLEQQQVFMTATTQGPLGDTQWRGHLTLGTPLVYDVTLSAHRLEVAQIMQQPSLPPTTFQFDASVRGRGTNLAELDSTVKVTLFPSRIGDITDAQGQFAGTVRNGRVTVETLALQAQNTMLTAQGAVDILHANPGGNLTYSLEAKDLTPWLALLHQQGKGAITLRGNASGRLGALQLAGNAILTDIDIIKYSLQSGTITYTLSGLGGPQAHGQATAVLAQMDAGIAWRTAKLTLDLAGTQPLQIHTDFTGQDTKQQTQHIKAQLHYTPQSTEVLLEDITIQLPTGVWRTPQPARVLVHQQTISIENFRLQRADSIISAQGMLSFDGTQNLQLQVIDLSLSELRMLWATDPQASGRLSATAQIQGTAAQPEISADITTSALKVTSQSYAGLTAHATYRQPQLQLTAALRQDATHTLSVTGNIPVSLSWAGALSVATTNEGDFRVHSDGLSLAFLNLFSTDIQDIQGTLRVDIQMRGPLQALIPTGQAWIENGQGRFAGLGLTFTEIGAAVQVTPSAVLLSSLRVRSGNGSLTASGSIGLESYTVTAIDLTLTADTFQIANTRQYGGAISGRLSGSGSLQHPMLHGALEVHETTLRPDIEILRSGPAPPDPTITVVRSAQALPAVSPAALSSYQSSSQSQPLQNHQTSADTLFDRLEMDIAVTIPRNTWIQLDEGTIEFMGQVRARKNTNEPFGLIGSIETVRGWYSLYGRKFRVEHGEIWFTGMTPIDPSLDVVAQYTLPQSQYSVEVVVAGTARTPSVTLRSEPSLEQADIVSLLIFGKPTTALNASEKTSLQSQALQTAAGYIASDLRRSLAQELGVENLELDVGNTLNQSRIGAGKYLSEDFFVSTSQQLGDTNSREFSIEYHLDQNWQIKATANTRGNDGIDIFWQKRY